MALLAASPVIAAAPDRSEQATVDQETTMATQTGPGETTSDITVTARRRAENAQNVPISITVLSDPGTTVTALASNASLARAVPNMQFIDGGGLFSNTASIRGVGSVSPLSSDDTSVVFYVDEVPQSVYSVAPNLFDTERVEALRGPQGTLFGRNTEGGAINIVSRRPSFDPLLELTGEVGSRGYGLSQIVANGVLVPDRLAGRLAIRWNGFGGDIPNIAAGGKDGAVHTVAARGSLLFTPDVRTDVLLTLNYGREETHSPRFLSPNATDFPVSATDPRTLVAGETASANLRVRHTFDGFALDTQTAFQRSTIRNSFDVSDALVYARVSPARPGVTPTYAIPGADVTVFHLRDDTFLQELRATALPASAVAWTVGVNYYRLETTAARASYAQTPPFNSQSGIQDNRFTVNSVAAFGEVTVPLTARLKATAGLRGTHEWKDAHWRYDGNGLPRLPASYLQGASLTDDFLTGRGMLSYDWNRRLMTYASVARGYVTAGFPAYSVNSTLAKPESAFPASTSWAYEAGFKSRFLGDRIMFNGAAFLNNVRHGHLVFFAPAQAIFTTVALDYRTYGGELEMAARITSAFKLTGGIGYTHAALRDVPANSFTGARSGFRVPNVPKFSANFGAEYRILGSAVGLPGSLTARASYQFVDDRSADIRNTFDLHAYGIVDTRLTWQQGDVGVYAFANNLLDKRYQAWGQAFGTVPSVRVGQGRVAGVGTSLRF